MSCGRRFVALAIVAVVVVIAACGGGSSHPTAATTASSQAPTGQRATYAGVTMLVPAGWAAGRLAQPNGLVIARNKDDLASSTPTGPRLEARLGAQQEPSGSDLVAGIDNTPFVGDVTTSETNVAGKPAASVEWTQAVDGANETTRTVVVSLDHQLAYVFTLQAPQNLWQASRSTLDDALASLTIDANAVDANR